ncbi:hypothetical protein MRB53_039345 [Persea americana]|nr:hypothetical protein MRB53_039345 [Persea americana]
MKHHWTSPSEAAGDQAYTDSGSSLHQFYAANLSDRHTSQINPSTTSSEEFPFRSLQLPASAGGRRFTVPATDAQQRSQGGSITQAYLRAGVGYNQWLEMHFVGAPVWERGLRILLARSRSLDGTGFIDCNRSGQQCSNLCWQLPRFQVVCTRSIGVSRHHCICFIISAAFSASPPLLIHRYMTNSVWHTGDGSKLFSMAKTLAGCPLPQFLSVNVRSLRALELPSQQHSPVTEVLRAFHIDSNRVLVCNTLTSPTHPQLISSSEVISRTRISIYRLLYLQRHLPKSTTLKNKMISIDDDSPLLVTGIGLPIEHELEARDRFAHGINEYQQAPAITARELAMLKAMDHITDKDDWDKDIFDDAIAAEWATCAAQQYPFITEAAWSWCLAELRDKAVDFRDSGLCESLMLVHVLARRIDLLLRMLQRVCNQNFILSSFICPALEVTQYQRLPCDVDFVGDNGVDVRIDSYINNLHPNHRAVYRDIEKIISASIPMWNACLVRVVELEQNKMIQFKKKTLAWAREQINAGRPESCCSAFGQRMRAEYIARDWIWLDRVPSNTVLESPIPPPTLAEKSPIRKEEWIRSGGYEHPDPGVSFSYADWKAGRNVDRAVIKMISQRSLVVLLIYLRLMSDTRLSWRRHFLSTRNASIQQCYRYERGQGPVFCQKDSPEEIRLRNNGYQYETEAIAAVFALGSPTGARLKFQETGTVIMSQGRLLTLSNCVEHKIETSLVDSDRSGRFRFVKIHLVDPNYRICSTSNVRPQQHEWCFETLVWMLMQKGLPRELADEIVELSQWPMSLDYAKAVKTMMKKERDRAMLARHS